jgi:hypothetical protein
LAAEGRDFVRRCVELAGAHKQWQAVCAIRRKHSLAVGDWSPEAEDYTWLETAFCETFLKPLRWFGSMDYEWRSGRSPAHSGFWVLLWSKDAQRMWWELQDEFERQTLGFPTRAAAPLYPSATVAALPPVAAWSQPGNLL